MERFFDGTDQENSKTQGGKGQIRKIKKNKKERMEEKKKKKEIFMHVEVSIPMCCPSVWNDRPRATLPQENPLLWEPPLRTTKVHELGKKQHQKTLMELTSY
jgi:hypothetical protein